jgi:exodeoxyribonuclease VII small subunit
MTEADTSRIGELGYAEAMAELEAILHQLERGDVDLDQLAAQVSRAAALVRLCRGRLDQARTEVTRIVADLDAEADARRDRSTGAAGAGAGTGDGTKPDETGGNGIGGDLDGDGIGPA